MHMNSDSAPYLLRRDRPDFERALDEALRSVETGLALSESSNSATDDPGGGHSLSGHSLSTEQLRSMALSAIEPIAACAAPEYEQYVKLREHVLEHLRAEEAARRSGGRGGEQPTSGAGLFAIVAVLTPILAGTAGVILLLLGYLLHAVHTPEPAIAAPLRTAGWLFAAVAACGILAGMVGLLLTALRNGRAASDGRPEELPPEVVHARTAWQRALVERGLRPFFQEALAKAADAPRVPDDRGSPDGPRIPRLGYSRPDFSSPGQDFDHPHDQGPRFSSPDFTSPDFSSPDFSGPDTHPR
jgi:hypothetical protein